MYSVLFAGALGFIVDCSQLESQANPESWQVKVCSNLAEKYEDVSLTAIKVLSRPVIDSSTGKDQLFISDLLAGRLNVVVTEEKNSEFFQQRYLFSVYATQNVWVAKKNFYKGDSIHSSDLELKKINVAPFVGLRNLSQQKMNKKILKNSVKKGGIIFDDYLEDDYLIAQWQAIELVVVSGNLKIQTKGIAMEPAINEGDIIKVRVVDTGAVVKGVVKRNEYIYVEI